MNIRILQLAEGAKKATGLVVIIDVFRAFSTDCYIFSNGASKIIVVENIDDAFTLKKKNSDYILIGERGGKKPEGFDYNNSPTEIESVDFTDKTLVQTTSAGTKGLFYVKDAAEVITGSFVNVGAVIGYIKATDYKDISLVCMGDRGILQSDEDTLCAEFIKQSLEGKNMCFQDIKNYLKAYKSAQRFFDPKVTWATRRDFDLCLSLNRFNFIIRTEPFDGKTQGISEIILLKKYSLNNERNSKK
ncbi:MAG: hypothetical protein B5M53_00085 [Candidatus Cloacimonas sp. 4484_209]|nr:MAG: hypothetical protein B5M53_00085 [Candidatus Cloacimonas sp. 4484_209]